MSEAPTQPAPYAFNVEEFYRMAEAGIFTEDDRVELLDGQIVRMSAIGSRHAACVARLVRALGRAAGDAAIVWVQNPVRLGHHSEPEPDVALLRPRADFYRDAHPAPADVLLVIEVADTTALFDRNVKMPLYARAGIPEVWLADLEADRIETYRDPGSEGYREVARAARGETVSSRAFPDIALRVEEIVG